MWPFNKSIEHITADDLRALIPEFREGSSLEYKLQMYSDIPKDAFALLKDTSSLANSHGGHLIIGMKERDGSDDGTPGELIGIPDGDKAQQRIESACKSCIKPPIIGLRVRDIPIGDEKSAVVVFVPDSGNKPHMIERDGKRDFYARHERQILQMSIDEIRSAVLRVHDAERSFREYREERQREIDELTAGEPCLWLYSAPRLVGPERLDVMDSVVNSFAYSPKNLDVAGFFIRTKEAYPTLHGIHADLAYSGQGNAGCIRILRSGFIDVAYRRIFDRESDRVLLDICAIEKATYWWSRYVYDLASTCLGGESMTLGAVVLNADGACMDTGRNCLPELEQRWHGSCLRLPEFMLQREDEYRVVAKRLMDRMWSAFRQWVSPNFDESGQLGVWSGSSRRYIAWELT